MKVSIPNLLEPCYELVEYAKKILSLAGVLYLVTWLKIFTSPRGKGWSDVLLMIRLLFTVSVSKGNLERMLYKLKLVKTSFRCSLGVKRFENILRIMEEGSSWETFDPISAIMKWSIDRVRCTTEETGSCSYRTRNSAKVNVKSLSDDGSYDEDEHVSENGDEEGYLFSSDSE